MKKRIINNKANKDLKAGKDCQPDHSIPDEPADVDSIKVFIKKRKLQNQVLEKLLKKISQQDSKESKQKSKNK